MFNWEEFENGKTAVYCDTEEKAKDFLRECDKHNLKWVSGDKAIEFNPWGEYRERTTITHRHNYLSYSTKEFFTDVQIIDWEIIKHERVYKVRFKR